jgi:diguanylate cyclase (GGDEF)-like protein
MTERPPPALPTIDWPDLMANPSGPAAVAIEAALTLAREIIQVWDAAGHLVLANPASDKVFGPASQGGRGQEQLYGDCLHDNGDPFLATELPVARILADGQTFDDLMMTTRHSENETRWLKVSGRPITNPAGAMIGAIITATDITDFIEHRQHLEHLASYDALTQLPNRLLLAERMRISLARGRRAGETVAVCMLDLDGFKQVNDNLGHKAGDELLREVALRLQESIRGDDTVARIGGDEFALLLCGIHKVSECEQSLTRLLARIAEPYRIADQIIQVGASVGVALFPTDGGDADLLLGKADNALYQAKEAGKGRFRFFDRKLDMRLQANRGLLRKIEKAIRDKEFILYYQPIVNCRKGQVESVEALIRWRHPVLGLLAPSEFLPLVDQDDLGIALGEWVISDALRQLAAWRAAGINLDVSVNISSRQVCQAGFTDHLAGMLAGYPPEISQGLRIEISEGTAMANVSAIAETIRKCHKLGVSVAIDHFGVGYASLLHLKRLRADTLKIDQSFVHDMLELPEDLAVVGGVIGFAAPFGCQVVAEGAETIEHLLTLLEIGCNLIQGYSLARPMPPDKLGAWLSSFQPDPLWRLSSTARPTRDHFELLLAEANHRAWINHALDLCHQNQYADGFSDHRQCPFGLWLAKPSSQRYHRLAEFREIERLHEEIHHKVRQIGLDLRDNRLEQAHDHEEKLLEDHLRLLTLLRDLRLRLNHEPRGRPQPTTKENPS